MKSQHHDNLITPTNLFWLKGKRSWPAERKKKGGHRRGAQIKKSASARNLSEAGREER